MPAMSMKATVDIKLKTCMQANMMALNASFETRKLVEWYDVAVGQSPDSPTDDVIPLTYVLPR